MNIKTIIGTALLGSLHAAGKAAGSMEPSTARGLQVAQPFGLDNVGTTPRWPMRTMLNEDVFESGPNFEQSLAAHNHGGRKLLGGVNAAAYVHQVPAREEHAEADEGTGHRKLRGVNGAAYIHPTPSEDAQWDDDAASSPSPSSMAPSPAHPG